MKSKLEPSYHPIVLIHDAVDILVDNTGGAIEVRLKISLVADGVEVRMRHGLLGGQSLLDYSLVL